MKQLVALDSATTVFADALEKADPGTTREAWAWRDSVREDTTRRLKISTASRRRHVLPPRYALRVTPSATFAAASR